MIKLSKLPDEVMDVIMEVSRETKTTPKEVIKTMLTLINKEEAVRAVYEYKRDQKR